MNFSIGVNKRFQDEEIFVKKDLKPEGFGAGEMGKQKALTAALKNNGSEIIYQNEKGNWFVQEVGEGESGQDNLSALSKIDKDHIKLHPTLNLRTRQNMHNAFISFKDDRVAFKAPENVADMSAWQKLKTGNSHALNEIVHEGAVLLKNPLSAGSDMAKGMVVNTWQTLTDPKKSFDTVAAAYKQDKTEGVLQGVKVTGSVVASVALVVGIGVAVGNAGVKLGSLKTGKDIHNAFEAQLDYGSLLNRAGNLARAGQTLGKIGQVTGTIGKAASLTILGATSLSLLKNEVDLARAKTPEVMSREVKQITQDAGSLAQSAAMYAVNKILSMAAEKTKQLYTENRNYQPISAESQAIMDQFIDEQSQIIAERVTQEVPEFNPKTWGTLPESDKMIAINKINQIFTDQMRKKVATGSVKDLPKFKAPDVLLEDLSEYSYGYYSPGENSITLNKNQLGNLSDIGNTLTHEGFHALQNHMMETHFADLDHVTFGKAFDENISAWIDNDYYTGYASQDNNIGKKVLGIPVEKLAESTGIHDFVIEEALFPGLDSYSEYATQPVETGAWRLGDKFAEAYESIHGMTPEQ